MISPLLTAIDNSQPDTERNGYHFACLLIVVVFAFMGGSGAHFATQGLNPDSDSKFKALTLKPLINGFLFPTLLAQLVWGAIASNGLSEFFDDHYDDYWGSWIRGAGTAIILVRVGGELDFKGKGLMFGLFAVVPSILETIAIAIVAFFTLDIPWVFGISLGFLISVISPAILVPICLKNKEKGLSLRVLDLMLSCSAFMVAFSIAGFCVFNSIGMMNYGNQGSGISSLIVDILKQVFVGIGFPILMAIPMVAIKGKSDLVKGIAVVFGVEVIMWFCTYANMPIGSVLAQIFFGYGCKINFGGKMPSWHLKYTWYMVMPFLFGHVGSQINLSKMVPAAVGYSFLIVSAGILARCLGAYLIAGMDKKFTKNEKLYIAIANIPKATCQCSMGGTLLQNTMINDALKSLEFTANNILTCAVFSVIIAGPLGAILAENLSEKLLVKSEKSRKILTNAGSVRSLNHETDVSDIDKDRIDSMRDPLLDAKD